MLPSYTKMDLKQREAIERYLKLQSKYPELKEIQEKIVKLQENPSRNFAEIENLLSKKAAFLKKRKIPLDIDRPRYDCKKCSDSGYIEELDQEASEEYGYQIYRHRKCQCLIDAEKQHVINKLFKTAKLTYTMHRQKFENFKLHYYSNIAIKNGYTYRQIMRHNRDIALEFVESVIANKEGYNGLYLQGAPGVGKTFLCSSIANRLIEEQVPVLYLPFVDFLYQLRETFSNSQENMEELIDTAKNVDVLILDDIGSENVSDFSQEILFTLLNHRTLTEKKPIVLSSNYTIEQLKGVYHPRVASRIRMLATILDCVGDDIREII